MGFLGSKRGLTPNLDAMASRVWFLSRAYSHVPLTTASHATIFTGTYPQFNHVNDFGVPLAASFRICPTCCISADIRPARLWARCLDPLDGTAPGFDRGFDVYDAGFHLRRHGSRPLHNGGAAAQVVVDHALGWLSQVPATDRSFSGFICTTRTIPMIRLHPTKRSSRRTLRRRDRLRRLCVG